MEEIICIHDKTNICNDDIFEIGPASSRSKTTPPWLMVHIWWRYCAWSRLDQYLCQSCIFYWKRSMYLLNLELVNFLRTLRRFAIIEHSIFLQDARSLQFPFKALTNDLMLLSKFSRESVWIMFCSQNIPCWMPCKILVVISSHARGPDWYWLLFSSARKPWANSSLELKIQV